VNMTPEWIEIGHRPGTLLLASQRPEDAGGAVRLAPDSATWWSASDA